MRHVVLGLTLLAVLGCSTAAPGPGSVSVTEGPPPFVLLEGDDVDLARLVGKPVTLIGTQARSKIPSVCGVDVDGDDDLSDTKVSATGILERTVIAPPDPDAPISAGRGPGTYYSLRDPKGGLAKTTPYSD